MANLGANINVEFTNTDTYTLTISPNLQNISPNQPDDIIELLFVKVGTIAGGYDPEFFQECMEDHFVCPICKGVLHNPTLIVECGHVFCENCLEENNRHYQSSTREPKCPMDNVILQTDLIQERFLKRYLLQKMVFCPLKIRGCGWEGELNEVNQHLEICQYFKSECLTGCGDILCRKDMLSHIRESCRNRKLKCCYCKEEFYFYQVDQHNQECPYFPVQCPHQCGTYLERRNMHYHLDTECPETSIECTYARFGCDFKSPRKTMTEHLRVKIEPHLNYILQYTSNLERMYIYLLAKCNQMENKVNTLMTVNNSNIAYAYSIQHNTITENSATQHSQETTNLDDVITSMPTALRIQQHRIPSNASNANNANNAHSSIDQVNRIDATAENAEEPPGASLVLTQIPTICQNRSPALKSISTTGANKSSRINNTIITNSNSNTDISSISFTWHIYDVEEKMQNEEEVFSEAFYSGPEGYKFCLSADMNGYESGEGTHLSVFIHMMKGPNDRILMWPFKGKFTVTLLNQINNDKHHTIEIQAGDANINAFRCPEQSRGTHGWGSHEFISHDDLKASRQKCQYLKDDSIHIRVTVDAEHKLAYWLW